MPRVNGFTNQYLTKAESSIDETQISSLAVLVFNSEESKNLVYYKNATSSTDKFHLNKSMLNLSKNGNLENATVVMLANIKFEELKKLEGENTSTLLENLSTLTLQDMEDYIYTPTNPVISSEPEGFAGFPMIGGKIVNLSSSTAESAFEVNLKNLYTKVNFEISVTQGEENQGTGMRFILNGSSVHNNTHTIPLAIPDNKGEQSVDFLGKPVNDEADPADADEATSSAAFYNTTTASSLGTTGEADLSGQKIGFTFYILESRYNPGTYEYPIENLHDSYKQQYKPKVAVAANGKPTVGCATYVLLNGTYTDYRGTAWTVNYKVYLGKNNYDNFHVDRNSVYTNLIDIKGIRNKDAQSDGIGNGDVWIDHRVNASTSDPSEYITITRETLIDSHIEVRPVRVKWATNTGYTFARIYLPYYTADGGATWAQRNESTSAKKNWIGIELGNKTGSLYCTQENSASKGKRKYFTNSLISELNTISVNTDIVSESDNDMFIALGNNECAWIYIDEYVYQENSTSIASNDRKAKIVVEFCSISNNAVVVKGKEEYILHQQPLIGIDKYYIENYEEYLHSYDSHDNYNITTSPTDYTRKGLKWGNNSRMSKSQFVTKTVIADWAPTNNEAYDFLHAKDKSALGEYKVVDKDKKDIDLTKNTGNYFTHLASANNGISISSMGEMPKSAYQYCLSKNKFVEAANGDDHEMMVHWYVPDVYELSDIFGFENSPLSMDCYYWSSQVPYTITQSSLLSATIASENISEARAVSKLGGSEVKPRSEQHHIRCLYSKEGIKADMGDRTPEGIGGLVQIPMTVADNGYFDFSSWMQDLKKDETTKEYDAFSYKFPKNDEFAAGSSDRTNADDDFSGSLINGVHYYAKNPLDKNNWAPDALKNISKDYYTIIHETKWPGLTDRQVENLAGSTLEWIAGLLQIDAICTLTASPKTDTKIVTTRKGKKIDQLPTNQQLATVPLDHNEDSKETMFISFSDEKNGKNSPQYRYYKEDPAAAEIKTYTKYWNVPEYSSTSFESEKKTYSAPERELTYSESEVLDAIDRAINGLISGSALDSEKCELLSNTIVITPTTTKSVYSYTSASNARNAAEDYFKNVINVQGEYKDNYSVQTSSKSIQLCSYTYEYQKWKRDWKWYKWGDWYKNGTASGSGTLSKTFYTYVITAQKKDGTYYKYVSGTGKWGDEGEPAIKTGAEAALETYDALTFYAGNSFTIEAAEGYYIRSVKVNYNTSTLTEGTKYLRFINDAKGLPSSNKEPSQMTYLDGANGWSKWTSEGKDSSIKLRLVICNKNANSWWVGNWGDPQMTHSDPSTSYLSTERDYSLIINSLEVRVEKIKDSQGQ